MFSHREAISLLVPYIRKRVAEQVRAVFVVVAYMLSFQVFVLGMPIQEAAHVATGLGLVIIGLAFFMEGLVLGLMPLGESLGLRLPRKVPLGVLLIFAFAIGMGATFAEPAIGVLRAAGQDVTPWEAPLLFLLLNKDTNLLVNFVSLGVGFAVCLGVLRFMFHFSLKPVLYLTVGFILLMTIGASFDHELAAILGLAWDCGAVTTGPVTVPLVLALGVGISRISGSDKSETSGFGIVTIASLFPIAMVLGLALVLKTTTPEAMTKTDFLDEANKGTVISLFKSDSHYNEYLEKIRNGEKKSDKKSNNELFVTSLLAAFQAILPLCLGMLIVLIIFVREKLTHGDEVFLGIIFAIVGMTLFNIGIEMGLANIGRQVGEVLPSAYQSIEMEDERQITNFDRNRVYQATNLDGQQHEFFYLHDGNEIEAVPFQTENLDKDRNVYTFQSFRGPLLGTTKNKLGTIIVLLFAFIMGYGATLAEPALNALGSTVENITAGALRKKLLIHSVAFGVGLGLTLGMVKIIWEVPMVFLLTIPYAVLIILTYISSDNFVNIAWDSAGVTTGPITVPLVIAMGLGIGSQSGVAEGFGVLAMASVCPILVVLCVGLWVRSKQHSSVSVTPYKSMPRIKEKNDSPSEEKVDREPETIDESA